MAIEVEVKIITGYNHLVTPKICRKVGLPVKGIMPDFRLKQLTNDALCVRNTTIFSRFAPKK